MVLGLGDEFKNPEIIEMRSFGLSHKQIEKLVQNGPESYYRAYKHCILLNWTGLTTQLTLEQITLIFKDCQHFVQRFFRDVSEIVQRCFRDCSEIVQRCFRDFERFFRDCSEMFQRIFRDFSEIFQRFVSIMFQIFFRDIRFY